MRSARDRSAREALRLRLHPGKRRLHRTTERVAFLGFVSQRRVDGVEVLLRRKNGGASAGRMRDARCCSPGRDRFRGRDCARTRVARPRAPRSHARAVQRELDGLASRVARHEEIRGAGRGSEAAREAGGPRRSCRGRCSGRRRGAARRMEGGLWSVTPGATGVAPSVDVRSTRSRELWRCHGLGATGPDVVVAIGGRVVVAVRGEQVRRIVVEAAATKHAVGGVLPAAMQLQAPDGVSLPPAARARPAAEHAPDLDALRDEEEELLRRYAPERRRDAHQDTRAHQSARGAREQRQLVTRVRRFDQAR